MVTALFLFYHLQRTILTNQIKSYYPMRYFYSFLMISCWVSLPGFAQEMTYQDTLEVEVGDNTKVIFLAQSAEDFAVLDRYDLNFLFDELWRMRQNGMTGEATLSRSAAEELRYGIPASERGEIDPIAKPLSWGGWFFSPTIGLTFGGDIVQSSGRFLLSPGTTEEVQYNIRGEIRSNTSTELVVGNSLLLRQDGDRKLRLRLAMGYSVTAFRIRNVRRERFQVEAVGGSLSTEEINELTSSLPERIYDRQLDLGMLFLEVSPRYEWRNRHPEGRWNVSAGVKAGFVIGDGESGLPGTSAPIYEWGDTQILLSQRNFQFALAGQVGYSFSNLFVNYYPQAFELSANVTNPEIRLNPSLSKSRNQGLWVVGTRFGF